MFNFTVTVQERTDGSIYTDSIDIQADVDNATPAERRVASAIKQAVAMARVARTRPTKKPGEAVSYADVVAVFSDLEWVLGFARQCVGGPSIANE